MAAAPELAAGEAVDDAPFLAPDAGDADLVAAIVQGDEGAVSTLVGRYHARLLRLARQFVRDEALAEDVVQDTWIGVLRRLDRFEGRSPFRTWLFRVLVNRARSRASREARYIPLDHSDEPDPTEASFDRSGAWRLPPRQWRITPERLALSGELRELVLAALERLPAGQRAVVELRDLQGFDASDVRAILGVSDANQRVLLHRGRLRLCAALTERLGA